MVRQTIDVVICQGRFCLKAAPLPLVSACPRPPTGSLEFDCNLAISLGSPQVIEHDRSNNSPFVPQLSRSPGPTASADPLCRPLARVPHSYCFAAPPARPPSTLTKRRQRSCGDRLLLPCQAFASSPYRRLASPWSPLSADSSPPFRLFAFITFAIRLRPPSYRFHPVDSVGNAYIRAWRPHGIALSPLSGSPAWSLIDARIPRTL